MFSYQIIDPPSFKFETEVIDKIINIISNKVDTTQNGRVNIVFVSPEEIKKFNNTYRQKDTVTDVLSFHYFEDFSKLSPEEIAGELIFCEEKIVTQGEEYKLGSEKEFYKLLIHSLLHILGYDHEEDNEYKIMQEKEDLIWREVFEK